MRHYEIVFLIHPDQSSQVSAMVDRYRTLIETASGTIHRLEYWGSRQLAHPINKIHKAQYILMNIECSQEILDKLEGGFRFNDAILRSLTLAKKDAVTEPSVIANAIKEENKRQEAFVSTEVVVATKKSSSKPTDAIDSDESPESKDTIDALKTTDSPIKNQSTNN